MPDGACPALDALSQRAVRAFHPFRAEPTREEMARRDPDNLTPGQREMLALWHYPYVFEEFRFHMTLTGPVPEPDRARIEEALDAHFAQVLAEPFAVDALARYVEPGPGANFTMAQCFSFAGAGAGRPA